VCLHVGLSVGTEDTAEAARRVHFDHALLACRLRVSPTECDHVLEGRAIECCSREVVAPPPPLIDSPELPVHLFRLLLVRSGLSIVLLRALPCVANPLRNTRDSDETTP